MCDACRDRSLECKHTHTSQQSTATFYVLPRVWFILCFCLVLFSFLLVCCIGSVVCQVVFVDVVRISHPIIQFNDLLARSESIASNRFEHRTKAKVKRKRFFISVRPWSRTRIPGLTAKTRAMHKFIPMRFSRGETIKFIYAHVAGKRCTRRCQVTMTIFRLLHKIVYFINWMRRV